MRTVGERSPRTGSQQATCDNCRHGRHVVTHNPLVRLYERFRPSTTCQVWVDRTTWWDGEICRCPDPVHRH